MNVLHRFTTWLFSNEVNALRAANAEYDLVVEERDKTIARLQEHRDSLDTMVQNLVTDLHDTRRLTLDDLKLKPNQLSCLAGSSSELRQAIYDAGEHVCLTELNEDARKAVVKFRALLMALSLHPTKQNQILSDRTDLDEVVERRSKLFTPKDV